MNNPTTVGAPVPATRTTVRHEGQMGARTNWYPRVRGGICEKCGVLDQNLDAQDQYKLCPHYRGMSLECNYCDPVKDQKEVTRISELYVYDHPVKRDEQGRPLLGCVCDSFTCRSAFNAEYRR